VIGTLLFLLTCTPFVVSSFSYKTVLISADYVEPIPLQMCPLFLATQGVAASPAGSLGMLVLLVATPFDTLIFWLPWFLSIAHAMSSCRWTTNDDISRSLPSATILVDVVTSAAQSDSAQLVIAFMPCRRHAPKLVSP
jgi:hypothetical protein